MNDKNDKESQRIFIGMGRPDWNEFAGGSGGAYVYCNGCGQILQTYGAIRDH